MTDVLEQPRTTRETAPAVADEAPPPPAASGVRLCAGCAAPMAADQDWCLECGDAQPGRLGGRHGWRAALTVVAVTGVLATGAVAASYAALSSEAQRQALAPAPPPAQPTVTQPPAQTVPAEEPPTIPAPGPAAGDDAPPPPPPPPEEEPLDEPAPPPPPASPPAPSAGSGGGSAPAPAGGSGGSSGGGSSEPAETSLDIRRAKNFNPDGRVMFGTHPPGDAIDGDSDTYWRAPVGDPGDEGDGGSVGVGLVLSLAEARRIGAARVTAGTPGFSLTVYGTKSEKTPQQLAGWTRIRNTRDFGDQEDLQIGGTYRHVLLWITDQPADNRLFITEVEFLR